MRSWRQRRSVRHRAGLSLPPQLTCISGAYRPENRPPDPAGRDGRRGVVLRNTRNQGEYTVAANNDAPVTNSAVRPDAMGRGGASFRSGGLGPCRRSMSRQAPSSGCQRSVRVRVDPSAARCAFQSQRGHSGPPHAGATDTARPGPQGAAENTYSARQHVGSARSARPACAWTANGGNRPVAVPSRLPLLAADHRSRSRQQRRHAHWRAVTTWHPQPYRSDSHTVPGSSMCSLRHGGVTRLPLDRLPGVLRLERRYRSEHP